MHLNLQTDQEPHSAVLKALPKQSVLSKSLFTLPFIVMFLVQLVHHQLWRDELNVSGIVLASRNIQTLFNYVHYEGHPSFWYLLIWISSQLVPSPQSLKIVEGLIGVAIYLMIGLISPFSRVEKILLFLGYFVFFEYTVLSRPYGLLLLLVLVYVHRRVTKPNQLLINAILLGLIANTDVLGCVLTAGLAVEYGLSFLAARSKPPALGFVLIAVAIYLGFVLFAIWTVKPPPDIGWHPTGLISNKIRLLTHHGSVIVEYLVLPWMPITFTNYPRHFWNPHAIDHPVTYVFLLPVILWILYTSFRNDRPLLWLIGITSVGAIGFGDLIYSGNIRNFGITFIAYLVAIWIYRSSHFKLPRSNYSLLVLSALGGVAAAVASFTHPFSNASVAASWLSTSLPNNVEVVGTPDVSVAGIAEELRRKVYFLECRCSDSFLLFSNRRDNFREAEMPDRLAEASRNLHRDIALVLIHPLNERETSEIRRRSLDVTPLAQFTGAEEPTEDFFFYSIKPRN